MFNQITWAGYCTSLLVLLLIYYVCVLFLCYRHEITQLISDNYSAFTLGQRSKPPSPLATSANDLTGFQNMSLESVNNSRSLEESDKATRQFSLVHELTHELHQAIEKAGKKNCKKEELIFSLQLLLKPYIELKESNFIEQINKLVTDHSLNYCSIPLNEEDLKLLWL